MKWTLYFLCYFSLLTSCSSKSEPHYTFNTTDFSYFDISPESFSLTRNDSVFLKQYFSSEFNMQLRDSITYLGMLDDGIKQRFDSLVASSNFGSFDSVYETGHIDGDDYELSINSDTLNKIIHVHSLHPPKELTALKKMFLKVRSDLKFSPTDTTIYFRTFSPVIPAPDTTSSR